LSGWCGCGSALCSCHHFDSDILRLSGFTTAAASRATMVEFSGDCTQVSPALFDLDSVAPKSPTAFDSSIASGTSQCQRRNFGSDLDSTCSGFLKVLSLFRAGARRALRKNVSQTLHFDGFSSQACAEVARHTWTNLDLGRPCLGLLEVCRGSLVFYLDSNVLYTTCK
jgi:hypothetical protein